jgi:acyl-CoA thioesterase YciA
MTEDPAPQGALCLQTIAMPADTNANGDIFGGWLMSQMDLAAGNLAARAARGRAATVAVDGMRFHLPVKVGDEVSLFAALTRRGRTSLHIHVTAWRRGRHEEVSQKVTCATFAFVALDDDGRPRPLPA